MAVRSRQERRRGSHKVRRMRLCRKLVRGFLVWWLWGEMVLISKYDGTVLCCVRYGMLCSCLVHFVCEKDKVSGGCRNHSDELLIPISPMYGKYMVNSLTTIESNIYS